MGTVNVDHILPNELDLDNTPEPWVTKTVVEGLVLPIETPGHWPVIDGVVRQDDSRLGCSWPDKPIVIATTISIGGHLLSYVGERVRVTIERLASSEVALERKAKAWLKE
jgi:hypothetical protein